MYLAQKDPVAVESDGPQQAELQAGNTQPASAVVAAAAGVAPAVVAGVQPGGCSVHFAEPGLPPALLQRLSVAFELVEHLDTVAPMRRVPGSVHCVHFDTRTLGPGC